MTIERKLLGTTPVSSGIEPEAVSFDGSSDWLSRSSDLTGNTDGGIFTFSFFVYNSKDTGTIYRNQSGYVLLNFSTTNCACSLFILFLTH